MLRTFIVLAVVLIAFEKASSSDDDVGKGNLKMSNCMKKNGKKSAMMYMMGVTPQCDEDGNFLPKQCYQSSQHCMCVRKDGSMINKPSSGIKECHCVRKKDKRENSGLLGCHVPQCEADGSYKKRQCHYSTGYCYCADPSTGKNTTAPSRDEVNCD